jgi:hypothetical protein
LFGTASVTARNRVKSQEGMMDEDRFNMEVRKFLKVVGVTSQREIEKAVRDALAAKRLTGRETLKAKVVLTVEAIDLTETIDGEIALA